MVGKGLKDHVFSTHAGSTYHSKREKDLDQIAGQVHLLHVFVTIQSPRLISFFVANRVAGEYWWCYPLWSLP